MLETLLQYLNNWFVQKTYANQDFTIADGSIALPFLQDGQFFRIRGSVFNDGLHQYPAIDLKDEAFYGTIDALAIPQAVQDLAAEMKEWADKYGETVNSPYSSESFGGYSYSKASADETRIDMWTMFSSQLSRWRKI